MVTKTVTVARLLVAMLRNP